MGKKWSFILSYFSLNCNQLYLFLRTHFELTCVLTSFSAGCSSCIEEGKITKDLNLFLKSVTSALNIIVLRFLHFLIPLALDEIKSISIFLSLTKHKPSELKITKYKKKTQWDKLQNIKYWRKHDFQIK